MHLLHQRGLALPEAKAVALHLARAGPCCNRCERPIEGSGYVECSHSRSLNLVW